MIKKLRAAVCCPKASAICSLVLFLILGMLPGRVAAQVSAYEVEQLPGAYSALASPTPVSPTAGNIDSGVYNTPIEFNFVFNGITYTHVNLSINGFLTFGATPPALLEHEPLTSSAVYSGAIALYGWDLELGAAATRFLSKQVTGSPGSRIAKFQWMGYRGNGGSNYAPLETAVFHAQIWLYEGTNEIELRYNAFTSIGNAETLGQIGLRGASNADFLMLDWRAPNTNWPAAPNQMAVTSTDNTARVSLRGTGNLGGSRILSSPAPGSNRLFRFKPVTCLRPTGLNITSYASNSLQVGWTAANPAPANGYEYYYTTSATPPTSATPASGSVGAGVTTAFIGGLPSSTTHYIYVRSVCGPGETSSWAGPLVAATLCPPVSGDYFNYFEEVSSVDPIYNYTAPAIQMCHSVQTVSGPNSWRTNAVPSPVDQFYDEHLVYDYDGEAVADTWFYTRGITLTAGTSYQLSYLYGGETDYNYLNNRMSVHLGTEPIHTAMTTLLDDHPNIKHGAITNYRNFSVPVTGTYYIGFHAYSLPNMGRMFLDDIQLVESVCLKPTGLTATNISATSATVLWNGSTPTPAAGYEYYLSTSNTPPGNSQVATGLISVGSTVLPLAGLEGSTTYYIWVRGNCDFGDKSEWSDVLSFTTDVLPPYCIPSATNTPTTFAAITNVTTTNGITNINNSSGISLSGHADYTAYTVTQSIGNTVNFVVALDDATAPAGVSLGTGVAIYVDWNHDGTFDSSERVYTSNGYPLTPTVSGSFVVPATATTGTTRMRVINDYWRMNPLPCDFGTSSGSSRGEAEDYSFRVSPPPPPLTINMASSTQCAGTPSATIYITSDLADFDSYSWSPATGVSGDPVNGYTITANGTIAYTLTAAQTSGALAINTAQFVYMAYALPTPITIADPGSVCSTGAAVPLVASGGVVSGFPIFSDNFNTGAPGWTTSHTNVGGNTAQAVWTLRPSPFNPLGPSWVENISSPDNSTYFLIDSDVQGSGNNTHARLESPTFSLAGYLSASLSFNHYYKGWSNGGGYVEISTNGGASYTLLQSYVGSASVGASNNFAPAVIDLGGYLGQTNLKLRFRYNATWGWGWAIDDVVVSGSANSAITWSPVEGLYTDAAATIPYTGTGAQTVYARPSVTTTYTASASTPSPVCTTSTTQEVVVIPVGGAVALPAAQTVCNLADPIELEPTTDTITGWQYSTDAAFTTPVAIPASASSTLTGAQIGTFAGTRYFRAVLSNGSCVGYSVPVTVSFTSTTWNGSAWSNGAPNASVTAIFAGNYTSTGDVNACSVLVTSGAVTFMPNHSLIAQNRVEVNGGTLTFENNASLVQVTDPASNENVGYITYKRNTTPIRMFDYTYWSSPLFPQTFVGVSPATLSDKYFRFDAASGVYVNVAGNSLMNPGQGYIIRAPQGWSTTPTVYNAVFNGGSLDGVPNNGVITTPIFSTGASTMNLVGNPYPSAIDAHALIDHPANALITGTLYFWTHNTPITDYQYTGSDYAIYNYTGGVGTGTPATNPGINNTAPTRYIAAGQGFFVEGTANGQLRFDNSMRVAGSNSNFYRVAAPGSAPYAVQSIGERHRLWLNISNAAGLSKQTLVGYVSSATNGIDRGFDGKVADAGNPVSLYSLVDGTALAIQGRALPFDVSDVVPMGYRANFAGVYQISLSDMDGLFHNQNVYLEDLQLGTIHDLKSGVYSFATETGTFDNRFVLRYTSAALEVSDPQFNNAVTVLNQNGVIHVHSGTDPMNRVEIYDVRGRLLTAKSSINDVVVSFDNLGLARQVLVVKVYAQSGAVAARKIVY